MQGAHHVHHLYGQLAFQPLMLITDVMEQFYPFVLSEELYVDYITIYFYHGKMLMPS